MPPAVRGAAPWLVAALLVASLTACDSSGIAPGPPPTSEAPFSSNLTRSTDPVWFSSTFGGGDGGPRAETEKFPARALTQKKNGEIKEKKGWLRFKSETVEAAGGRTRIVRFLVRDPAPPAAASHAVGGGGKKVKWVRAFVAEVPDLNEAEEAVLDWLKGSIGATEASRVQMLGGDGNCEVMQLDPGSPGCEESDALGMECWATVCDGGGGGDWPPPDPYPSDPPPSGPSPGDGGGGSGGTPGDGPGTGPGESCDPNAILQPVGCEPTGPVKPPDVSQEDWNNMNDPERELCAKRPFECPFVYAYSRTAIEWAVEDYEGVTPGCIKNGCDALRHAYWMGLTARSYGVQRALDWGYAHEQSYINDPAAMDMDLHNNRIGAELGYGAFLNSTVRSRVYSAYVNRGLRVIYP